MPEIKEKKRIRLNPKQELFCQAYVSQECFGNATRAYMLTYFNITFPENFEYKYLTTVERKKYNVAANCALKLLRIAEIKRRTNELLDALIKDEIVDRELAKVIMQNNELAPKVAAIKEYNAVRKRTEPNKVEITFQLDPEKKKLIDKIMDK